jgi:hypothetical protein
MTSLKTFALSCLLLTTPAMYCTQESKTLKFELDVSTLRFAYKPLTITSLGYSLYKFIDALSYMSEFDGAHDPKMTPQDQKRIKDSLISGLRAAAVFLVLTCPLISI